MKKRRRAPVATPSPDLTSSRSLVDEATSLGERSSHKNLAQPDFHHFDQVRIQPANEAARQTSDSCPLSLVTPRACPFGGACHTCPVTVQTKLTINKPGDKYEQEADRVAEQVMHVPGPRLQRQEKPDEEEETLQAKPLADQITPLVQRQAEPEEEEEEETVQTKLVDGARLQRQVEPEEEEEEEPAQAKLIDSAHLQRQAEPEEEEEEEEPVQTKPGGGRPLRIGPRAQAQVGSLRTGGRPLSPSERSFFEPRFGRDFGHVRIHTDSHAAAAARAVNARAFTVEKDIVFGVGQYAPESSVGRRLLAHELTHVIQQNGRRPRGTPSVQRATKDYDVRGRYQRGKGGRLEKWVFFDAGDYRLSPGEADKVEDFVYLDVVSLKGRVTVTLFGYSSEEGSSSLNRRVINRRLARVSQAIRGELRELRKLGFPTPRVSIRKRGRVKASGRFIDYRRWRAVEMVVGRASSIPRCSPGAAYGREPFDTRKASAKAEKKLIESVRSSAASKVKGALDKLKPPPPRSRTSTPATSPAPTTATKSIVRRLFGSGTSASISTVHSRLGKVRGEIMGMTPVTSTGGRRTASSAAGSGRARSGSSTRSSPCYRGTVCNLGCRQGWTAYQDSGVYVFCGKFFRTSDRNHLIRVLIHEAAHGTPGLYIRDFAYGSERLIENLGRLEPDKALKNADSYAVLVMLLTGAGVRKSPPRDVYSFAGPRASAKSKKDKVRDAISYAQSWVSSCGYVLGKVYGWIHQSGARGRRWATTHWSYRAMKAVSSQFALPRPPRRPRRSDAWKVAAIYDRVRKLGKLLAKPFTFQDPRSRSGTAPAGAKPPRTEVAVPSSFFTLPPSTTPAHILRARILLRRIIAREPSISAALKSAYATLAERFFNLRRKIFAEEERAKRRARRRTRSRP